MTARQPQPEVADAQLALWTLSSESPDEIEAAYDPTEDARWGSPIAAVSHAPVEGLLDDAVHVLRTVGRGSLDQNAADALLTLAGLCERVLLPRAKQLPEEPVEYLRAELLKFLIACQAAAADDPEARLPSSALDATTGIAAATFELIDHVASEAGSTPTFKMNGRRYPASRTLRRALVK